MEMDADRPWIGAACRFRFHLRMPFAGTKPAHTSPQNLYPCCHQRQMQFRIGLSRSYAAVRREVRVKLSIAGVFPFLSMELPAPGGARCDLFMCVTAIHSPYFSFASAVLPRQAIGTRPLSCFTCIGPQGDGRHMLLVFLVWLVFAGSVEPRLLPGVGPPGLCLPGWRNLDFPAGWSARTFDDDSTFEIGK